jgi:hypothetical protein
MNFDPSPQHMALEGIKRPEGRHGSLLSFKS